MIPEEVAQIANIIRNWFDPDYDDSIDAAWEIYRALQENIVP